MKVGVAKLESRLKIGQLMQGGPGLKPVDLKAGWVQKDTCRYCGCRVY